MTNKVLEESIFEAERFVERAKNLLSERKAEEKRIKILKETTNPDWIPSSRHPAECGSVKRASMDLTRVLAKLRSTYTPY